MNIFWAHKNPNEWQKPDEFHPERFDPSHEMAKTPSGQPRNEMAFIPFSFGDRKCLGYMFAKAVIPSLTTKIIHNFDIELMDPQLLASPHTYPIASATQNLLPPIPVTVTPTDNCDKF